jgi:hypothetical protein
VLRKNTVFPNRPWHPNSLAAFAQKILWYLETGETEQALCTGRVCRLKRNRLPLHRFPFDDELLHVPILACLRQWLTPPILKRVN